MQAVVSRIWVYKKTPMQSYKNSKCNVKSIIVGY